MKTLFVLLAVAVCFSAYASTDVRAGAWTAELDNGTLQMTVFQNRDRESGRGPSNIMGFDVPVTAFSNLSVADVQAGAANVQFELQRAAGTIAFDGRFSDGTGAGHFRFTPNDRFNHDMESLGYSGFDDSRLLLFVVNDFSPQVIRDLRAMGYEPTQKEVEEIAIFRVTADLMREYAKAGYPNLTLRQAVQFRIGRVDGEYITAMRALGYGDLSANKLANLAILGARPAVIEEYRALGYTDISPGQLEQMTVFRVTPDYIRKLKALGYNNVPADKLVKLKMSGLAVTK